MLDKHFNSDFDEYVQFYRVFSILPNQQEMALTVDKLDSFIHRILNDDTCREASQWIKQRDRYIKRYGI